MSLTVVFSTKKINLDFVEIIKATSGVHNIEILPYENPGKYSLTEVYNMGIKKAKNDIIIVCHDDIKFDTKNWGRKILKLFKRHSEFGIIGVAGSRYMPESGKWWEDFSKMHGAVYHENKGERWLTRYSKDVGNQLDDVLLVDGLFFAINKKILKHKFNSDVEGFHFYDVDFCFSNYLEGVRIGVCTDIRISHLSIGVTNDEWEKNRVIFAEKYKDSLPVKIKRTFPSNDRFDILIACESVTEPLMELLLHLKKENHNITLCGECTVPQHNILKRKNINTHKLNSPPGYAVGDGVWSINTPEGPQPTEKNKLYKIKEIKFDIVHSTHNQISTFIMPFYPNTPEFRSDDEKGVEGDIIKKYKEILEW